MPNLPEHQKTLSDLSVQLESWQNFGIKHLTLPQKEETGTSVDIGSDLDPHGIPQLQALVTQCERCPHLVSNRTTVVFGTGSEKADLVFVGEAPGYEEDQQGKPFVGKAGMLLTRIIEAMGFKREDVYICNVLKCRPPQNRNPLPDEVENCRPYLIQQLSLLKPKVLVALGKFAAQTLLSTERPISQLRGKFHEYRGIPVMPTFHPAYLLRNEADKKLVWEDMKQVLALLKKN